MTLLKRYFFVKVNYANLGIIDYVDEAGNKIPGSSTYRINNSTETITANGKTYNKIYDAGVTELPPVPAGYRIKYASADKSKANAYVDVLKSERQYDYNNGIATIRSERTWDRNQSRVVDLVQFANGSQGLDASIDANGGGQYLAPGYRYHIIVEKDTKDVTKATSQTVTYTGADTKTPAANAQNDFSFNGKEDPATNTTTWTETTHTYGTVKTPVVTGYYADKAVAGGKTVTPDAPNATDTVTYKAFGKSLWMKMKSIPGVSTTAYKRSNDATKMIAVDKTLPSIPGYTVRLYLPHQVTCLAILRLFTLRTIKASVTYRDETSGSTETVALAGKSGETLTTQQLNVSTLSRPWLCPCDRWLPSWCNIRLG
ncbi:MAG: mucin-binding protein [Streptococcus sp.]